MTPPRYRSVMFMPASNARAVAKARELPCDAVILDLEDAVAPDAKEAARAAAVDAVRAGGFGARRLVVRINAPGTSWGGEDAAAMAACAPDAVLLPKVDGPDDLARARAAIGPGPDLWAMIETCRGVLALSAIADTAASLRLAALVAGTNDLARELRCRVDAARTPLVPALMQIVTAARARGLVALDGVRNAIDDPDGLAAECAQGASFGFDGKTLIHPAQVAAANAAFSPDADALAWARRVIAAFAEAGATARGAIRLDGAMVERLHLGEAERIMALADRGATSAADPAC